MNLDELKKNQELFGSYNKLKLKSSFHLFTDKQKIIFKILPFLLHLNIKGLPGYLDSKNVPVGISGYKISEQTINIIKNKFEIENLKITESSTPVIESLSIMGSIGSIAQNEKSDFDFWVCINRDNMGPESFEIFKKKLKAVEDWCSRQNVETHLFPVDINSVLKNDFGSADDESCGSAQAVLLKDEYFRSAIHIEGKIPLWWVSPLDSNYSEFVEKCKKNDDVSAKSFLNNFINIGYIDKVNKDEFLGAGLWQLVKSLHSPFKSFIKMSLLEKYINASSEIDMLSEELKKNILLENFDLNKIDQYISMFNSVSNFYIEKNSYQIIDILRNCFYLKVNPCLSQLRDYQINENLKFSTMNDFCNSWKWDKKTITKLDNFNRWSFKELRDFDNTLKNFMKNNYVNLSASLNTSNIDSILSEEDRTVITRKLLAYYSKKPSKVEYFYFSLEDSYFEETLNIVFNEKDAMWTVNRYKYENENDILNQTGLIFKSKYLSEICHLLAYNGIYNEYGSALKIFAPFAVNFNNVKNFIITVKNFFSAKRHILSKREYYLKENFIVRCLICVNFSYPNKDTVQDIVFIFLNSWGEMYYEHLDSYTQIILKMDILLENYNRIKHLCSFEEFITMFIPEGAMGVNLPLKRQFQKYEEFFFTKKWFGTECKIFITQIDGEYFGICQLKKIFSLTRSTSNFTLFDNFFNYKNSNLFFEYDNSIRDAGFFQAIFSKIEIGKNQMFVYNIGKYYFWLFFDEFNLPVFGAILVEKYDEFIISFKIFIDKLTNSCEMYIVKKDMNEYYSLSPIKSFSQPALKNIEMLQIEFNYDNEKDFVDFNKYSIIINNKKLILSSKQDFAEYAVFAAKFFLQKVFSVISVTILSNGKILKAQSSLFVKVKNKFEKNTFTLLEMLKKKT